METAYHLSNGSVKGQKGGILRITTEPEELDRMIKGASAVVGSPSASAWVTKIIRTLLSEQWLEDMETISATMETISATAGELQDPSAPGRIALDVDLDALAEALTRVTELGGA